MARHLAILAAVAALAWGGPAGATGTWVCPPDLAGQTLSVYSWAGYVAPDTIPGFEAACGVRVIYDTYLSDGDMFMSMRQGNPGYDVTVPSDRVAALLAGQGLLVPLDRSLLPNWVHLDPTFLDLEFDPGNRYSVPYLWGALGIGYHRGRVGSEITSWMDMFTYDGPVSWIDDARAMMGAAAVALGLDPNTGAEDDLAAIRAFLVEQGRNVVYIHQDDGQDALLRGQVDIVVEFSGDVFQLAVVCGCDDFGFVIPREGATFWVDSLVIPVGATNLPLAHAFLDYLMDAAVAAAIADATALGSPNRSAAQLGLIGDALLGDLGVDPAEGTAARLFRVDPDPGLQRRYDEAWEELKTRVGR